MDKAIEIGERLGIMRNQSSCDYSYLCKIRQELEETAGGDGRWSCKFDDIAYIQKMIDVLEAA